VQPGTRLGSYEVVAKIGSGGMGEVYRARDTRLGQDVAIKMLPVEFASDPDRLRHFRPDLVDFTGYTNEVSAIPRLARLSSASSSSAIANCARCAKGAPWRPTSGPSIGCAPSESRSTPPSC
jgi:serine/threonine protein kinase